MKRKKTPTESEIAESEKRKKQRQISVDSAERRQRRIRRLIDLGFSAEFAANNHSTDAAYALLYLESRGLVQKEDAKELYSAIESNRQTGGKLYPAWLRDEVGDSDFIHRVVAAYRRHAYTDYEEILAENRRLGLCGEDAREIAREQIRQ
ncbi:MAG TPA: hypothetical protein PLP49_11600 [Anaerohalosphaeraceae bacterium]|nr:hypothetical protein [Anaerohalosphaeraceae bacterium]